MLDILQRLAHLSISQNLFTICKTEVRRRMEYSLLVPINVSPTVLRKINNIQDKATYFLSTLLSIQLFLHQDTMAAACNIYTMHFLTQAAPPKPTTPSPRQQVHESITMCWFPSKSCQVCLTPPLFSFLCPHPHAHQCLVQFIIPCTEIQ